MGRNPLGKVGPDYGAIGLKSAPLSFASFGSHWQPARVLCA